MKLIPALLLLLLFLRLHGPSADRQAGSSHPTAHSVLQSQSKEREPAKKDDASDLTFTGEVFLGKPYEREIGHDLIFRLSPVADLPEWGWRIEILPKVQLADRETGFASVATPPYHFFNPLYLDTSYGTTAEAAVAMSTRPFNFVLSMTDFRAADDAVNLAIYSTQASADQRDRIVHAAAKVQVGQGELHILKSRVTTATEKDKLGKIEWLKFEVRLRFQSGVTVQEILGLGADSPKGD